MNAELPGGYSIETGPELIEWERVATWLTTSYWSPGITQENVQRAAAHSALVIGVFHEISGQVGYARVVSDNTRFAYLCDVWVDKDHRNRGLARAMVRHALDHPDFATVKWMLGTKDAHRLYASLGFIPLPAPERFMVRPASGGGIAVGHGTSDQERGMNVPANGVEVIGIDHIYMAVIDMARSEAFYDRVMPVLGFRKNSFLNDGDLHVQYFNRHFGYVLRPAAAETSRHDPLSPGLHHFCFRVEDAAAVDGIYRQFVELKIESSRPQLYPEYAPDYYAIFFQDPDGIRLEVTNYREERRRRFANWPNVS